MTNLFAFSLCGKTLFFRGEIPEDKFEEVERIANSIAKSLTMDEYAACLVKDVFRKLKIQLEFCPIAYVFRVRNKDGYHTD